MDLHDYWKLSPEEQEAIRQANPGYADTEEDYQAFLDALFPTHYTSFNDAMRAAGADSDE